MGPLELDPLGVLCVHCAVEDRTPPPIEAVLDADERAMRERVRFERDWRVRVVAYALRRVALSAVVGGAPQEWRFHRDAAGKPEPATPPGARRLRTSLSHSPGMVAVAIGFEDAVGVDVEPLWQGDAVGDVVGRFLERSEQALLAATPQARRGRRLIALWTLKEAYLKATGEGVTEAGLRGAAMVDDPPGFAADAATASPNREWAFDLFRAGGTHQVAVAARRAPGARRAFERRAVSINDLVAAIDAGKPPRRA